MSKASTNGTKVRGPLTTLRGRPVGGGTAKKESLRTGTVKGPNVFGGFTLKYHPEGATNTAENARRRSVNKELQRVSDKSAKSLSERMAAVPWRGPRG